MWQNLDSNLDPFNSKDQVSDFTKPKFGINMCIYNYKKETYYAYYNNLFFFT